MKRNIYIVGFALAILSFLSIIGHGNTYQDEAKSQIQSLIQQATGIIEKDIEKAYRLFLDALEKSKSIGDKTAQAYCNYQLGQIMDKKGNNDVALVYLAEALALSKEINNKDGVNSSLSSIGLIYTKKEDYANALKYFLEAKEYLTNAKDSINLFYCLEWIGVTYAKIGDFFRVLEYTNELLKFSHSIDDKQYEKRALKDINSAKTLISAHISKLINEGSNLVDNKDPEKALPVISEALNEATLINDPFGQIMGNYQLARISELKGGLEEAIQYSRKALTFARSFNEEAGVGIVLANIGHLYFKTSNYIKARDALIEYAGLLEEKGDDEAECRVLTLLGLIHMNLGEYSSAMKCLNESSQLGKRLNNVALEKEHLECMSVLYEQLNDLDNAFYYLYQAQKLAQKTNNPEDIIANYRQLGKLNYLVKNYSNAISCYEKALSLATSINDKNREGLFKRLIGKMYFEIGDDGKSLEYFMPALRDYEEINSIDMQLDLSASISGAYSGLKRWDEAKQYAERALELAQKTGGNDAKSQALLVLGIALLGRGEIDNSLKYLSQCADLDEYMIRSIQDTDLRTNSYVKRDRVYEYLLFLYSIKQLNNETIYTKEAFKLFEKSRARGLLDILSDVKTGNRVNLDQKEMEYEDSLYEKIGSYNNSLNDIKSQAEKADLSDKIFATQVELEEFRNRIRKDKPQYASIRNPRFLSVSDVQNKILKDRDEALLEYSIGREYSFLYIIGKNKYSFLRLNITIPELTKSILGIRSSFELIKSGESLLSQLRGFDTETAHDLYDELLLPAEPFLKGVKKLIVVPSGCMFYLPFEMLVYNIEQTSTKKEYLLPSFKGIHFIIEKYSISYAPSSSVLNPDMRKDRAANRYRGDLLAFANPHFERYKTEGTQQTEEGIYLPMEYRNELADLPNSEKEIEEISKSFDNPLIFKKEYAQKKEFIGQSPSYPIIHISSHGLLNETNPLYSGIAFAYNPSMGTVEILNTREIFGLNLDCELVTLSACETALGQRPESIGGEGVFGLTRAFLYAGAKSIIVSQWVVEDESTSLLMAEFYKNLKLNKMSKADSLRQAKLTLMKQEKKIGNRLMSYSHPFFWAPFVLIGNPN